MYRGMTNYIFNPVTNRMILKSSRQAVRLSKLGLISLDEPTPVKLETVPESNYEAETPEPESEPEKEINPKKLKKKMIHSLTDIAAENKNDFKDLTQKETDDLLRKLLYKKLNIKKPVKKLKKKKKKYISSDSESSSESD
jgi:hypothetical protein